MDIYKQSLELYNNIVKEIKTYEPEQFTQSNTQPMHPNLYYQLSSVRGFNNLNGSTYSEYLNIWKGGNKSDY